MVICQKEDLQASNQFATKISTQLLGLKIGGIVLCVDLTGGEITNTHFQAQKIICVETMICLLSKDRLSICFQHTNLSFIP